MAQAIAGVRGGPAGGLCEAAGRPESAVPAARADVLLLWLEAHDEPGLPDVFVVIAGLGEKLAGDVVLEGRPRSLVAGSLLETRGMFRQRAGWCPGLVQRRGSRAWP